LDEEEYQAGLALLRDDWGLVHPDPDRPGVIVAMNDPTTGILVGMRSKLIAEIINRVLANVPTHSPVPVPMRCPECGIGEPGHAFNCSRCPSYTLGPRS
jgi:hypothetical protein